jgi:hypothetical protein
LPAGPESDLDVAVRRLPDAKRPHLEIYNALSRLITEPVVLDLVLLDTADPLLRWEVMRAAKLRWGDAERFEEYRLYA